MLEIKKVSKIYVTEDLKQTALNGVSINFRENEFAAILGPSGSGKTTLLNIIGGLDHYDSGDLIINEVSTKKYTDRDWDSYRNHRVGFVFQNYNLITHQSVLSNVELALTLSGISKKERIKRAKDALKSVGLERHMNKRPNQLSGGQMQRVAIARALINDPDIILADEPTGALDSETSKQIMKLLADVAKDKLVIMVTHNPELAHEYSNRIIELKDGKIINDTNPYDGKNIKEYKNESSKKTQMSFITSLSLSLNNLLTKKGRTFLTALAGSIGIIGIALILSLSNGIQDYIDKTEKETLSSYPLTLESESVDMTSLLNVLTGNQEKVKYDDDKIHSINIMGDMLSSVSNNVKSNDLSSFKKFIETKRKDINNYVTDIQYVYNLTMNIYKNDDTLTQVNPTTIFDALGMNASGISSAYSSYMSSYDVFVEMLNNKELINSQFDIVAGRMPESYDEVILAVNEDNQISDYTLYSLGLLDQEDLKKKFNQMISGEKIEFEPVSYTKEEILNLTFKLVLASDVYERKNNVWLDMSKNEEYMKKVLNNSLTLKVVGIVKPNEEAVIGQNTYGIVYYTHDLAEYMINEAEKRDIVKMQKANDKINIFTGMEFNTTTKFDYSTLTKEQLQYIKNLSPDELAKFMETYTNNATATYNTNLTKLGVADINSPYKINIYPKDFDSKEDIKAIIDDFNKGKNEEDKLTYTDVVGIMMKSVSTIVSVVSKVLIAFVAISLVVSSIMIAIITYISVIERTKEIGILRAIGASKKDISRVFNAETLIEGFAAGILGIAVTMLLNIPINLIIKSAVNISGLSKLPVIGAILLIIISIVLTLIAGLIPARIASKKDPVEALRTE